MNSLAERYLHLQATINSMTVNSPDRITFWPNMADRWERWQIGGRFYRSKAHISTTTRFYHIKHQWINVLSLKNVDTMLGKRWHIVYFAY